MKSKCLGLFSLGFCVVFAAPTAEEVEGRWQLSVPEGESYTMTADDVAQIGDRAFQKAGGGLLVTGDEMGSHTGDVYVVEGIYKNTTHLSFGTTNGPMGKVVVNGGTLCNTVGASSSGNLPAIKRPLYLQGEGHQSLGAISNTAYCANIGHNIWFTGDVKLTGNQTLNFRYDTVNLGGYTLTTEFAPGNGLMFVALMVSNPGDIRVKKGFCGFESATAVGGTADQTMSFDSGAYLRLSVLMTPQGRTFDFADNTRIATENWDGLMFIPATGYHGSKDTGTLTGPVILNGTLTANGNAGMGVSLAGVVSGPGRIAVTNGTWLRLTNAGNTFEGGVDVVGQAGAGALDMKGGLALAANGALPASGPALTMKNATLGLFSQTAVDLPDLKLDGTVAVTGYVGKATYQAKSLTKTGTGPLTVFGPLAVQGPVDIQGGTLRFGSQVPMYIAGLAWAHDNTTGYYTDGNKTVEQVQQMATYQQVEPTGLKYAYSGWVNTVATTNASDGRVDWHNNHHYAGYMKIPGEPGEVVNCRIISCISRNLRIAIDGTTVYQVDDSKVIVPSDFVDPGSNLGWTRHAWSNPIPLEAGWHHIYCYMGNHYQTGGPNACYSATYGLWPGNFGIGMNYNASADDDFDTKTNVVNYVKLLDPGDGSLFRLGTNSLEKATRSPETYRPTFGGAVAFASGTTLDIGDTAPYTPVVIPSLTGVPTILNGRVEVQSSLWTLRAADVTGGTPLTIDPAAELVFPAGPVTVDLAESDLETLDVVRKQAPYAILTAATPPENIFQASDRVKSAGWRLQQDGATLSLVSSKGLTFIIR